MVTDTAGRKIISNELIIAVFLSYNLNEIKKIETIKTPLKII